MSGSIDEGKLEEIMGRLGRVHDRRMRCAAAMWLGDELGLYRTMAGAGPVAADEVAVGLRLQPRGSCANGSTARPRAGSSSTTPTRDTYELGDRGCDGARRRQRRRSSSRGL